MRSLSMEDLHRAAPSIFAQEPWGRMSEKYRFFPTMHVVEALMKNGFSAMSAGQSNTRIEGKADFTRHVVRFRHNDLMRHNGVGTEIPEIILMNSHDGSSSYKLMMGIFRMVCANGMIVKSSDINEIRVRHSGSENLINDVIEGSYEIINEAPKVIEQIESWKNTMVGIKDQTAFARAALELRGTSLDVEPLNLLKAKRAADANEINGTRDVWKTMNVVQENLIRGGVQGRRANGERQRLRGIKSVDVDTKLNRALWTLTEHFSNQIKAA